MNQEPLKIHYVKFGSMEPRKLHDPTAPVYMPQNTLRNACELAGVPLADVLNPIRLPRYVRARWHVMTILREWGRSTTQIGRMLNMDHTTVVHGLRRWGEINAAA